MKQYIIHLVAISNDEIYKLRQYQSDPNDDVKLIIIHSSGYIDKFIISQSMIDDIIKNIPSKYYIIID